MNKKLYNYIAHKNLVEYLATYISKHYAFGTYRYVVDIEKIIPDYMSKSYCFVYVYFNNGHLEGFRIRRTQKLEKLSRRCNEQGIIPMRFI